MKVLKKFAVVVLSICFHGYMFGEYLCNKHVYEVTGQNINIRNVPNGNVIRKVSEPGILIHGIPEDGALGGDEWIALVDLSGYDDGYISSKYVKPIQFRKFDDSFCGSYFGEGQAPMENYSYSLAQIEKKPHGWYVMTITDFSEPQGAIGFRSQSTKILAGKTFQSMEYNPAERMNDFDGIWFFVELSNASDLDNIKPDEYPTNIVGEVNDEYFIVTGEGELTSRCMKLTRQ
ncbi:MAG: hypothetical protein K2K98_07540 [Muribaculaceae bacterium]|nr:hypothetical protein [Muribaculaceae bacterium]